MAGWWSVSRAGGNSDWLAKQKAIVGSESSDWALRRKATGASDAGSDDDDDAGARAGVGVGSGGGGGGGEVTFAHGFDAAAAANGLVGVVAGEAGLEALLLSCGCAGC